ncbi:hypothetical protein AgCh_025523 [Apium graveolens]
MSSTQVQALTSLVKSQQIDIQTLVDSQKHLQMQNSVALGAIMGKLNIPLPSLPEQVRPEIHTPLLMPSNKTKGEIEARIARSRSSTQQVQGAEKILNQEVDLDMERLIRAAEGPSLSREFDELLKALKASFNDNHFTYKKALDRIINFLRVIMVNQDNFLQKRIVININDSGIYRCMQVSLNYLVSRRASELDIMINKVKVVTHEDTMLLTELKNAQVAAFPEAYLQPSKECVMANKKLIKILETDLKSKKNKNDDVEMIKLLGRYLSDAEANLPRTQINKDNLNDDEQKKNDKNPSISNPCESTKPSGSKGGEKKKGDDKKNDEKKRANERRNEDNFQQLVEKIVRVWVVSRRERIISLLEDKDNATRAWRSVIAEWLIEREETIKINKAEFEERRRKCDEEIEMYIKRSEELKAKGMIRISKDGKFLNIKAGGFSRFRIDLLDNGYPKVSRQKLVEALSDTPIIEELEILDHLKDAPIFLSRLPPLSPLLGEVRKATRELTEISTSQIEDMEIGDIDKSFLH